MKKLLYGFLLIVLLVVIVPNFVDWSHYKSPLIAALKRHTGLEVDFKGPLHLKLLPTLCIDATEVVIKNNLKGKAANLLEVENISMKVTLWSLMRGRVNIDKATFLNPTLYLEVLQDGQQNWVFENSQLPKEKLDSPSQEISPSSEGVSLSLKKVEIKEGKVIYKNFQTDLQEEIQHVNLQGSLESLKGPFGFEYQMNFRAHTFKGDVQVDKTSEAGRIPFHARLAVASTQNKLGTLEVKGSAHGTEIEADIHSDDLSFPFPINFGDQKVGLPKVIKISGHLMANPQNIQLSHLTIDTNLLKVKGNANVQLSPWQGELTLSEGASKINLSIKSQNNTPSAWGGKAIISLAKPEFFWQCLGVDPSLGFLHGVLEISTDFIVRAPTYTFNNLRFTIGNLQGSGMVTVNQSQRTNHIRADLSVNKLDMNTLLSTKNTDRPSRADDLSTSLKNERWSKDKWNLSFLKAVDMDCKLKVRELIYDKYNFQDVKGTIQIKNGNLKLTDCQAQGYKGYFKGGGALTPGQATSLHVNIKANGLDPLAIPEVAHTPLKKALLDMSMNITAKGDSVSEAINSLAGNVQIVLKQGVIEAFDVKSFVSSIRHVKNPADISALMTTLNKKSETSFSHLKADFSLKNGQATTSNLELLSEEAVLTGEGNINLPQWHIDMRTQMRIKDKVKLPPIGVKIEGSLTDPSYKIDQDVLTKVLVQAASRRVLDKVIEKEGLVGQMVAGVLGVEEEKVDSSKSSTPSKGQDSTKGSSLKIGKVLGEIFNK